ncbi:MAG: carboxylesterase family protein [Gammaproteobacteria bacterium]|nr:carboxylesterase family protein [Gammaproteobacteria bacterium]MCP4831690.1 carboxylesterase family protein [Gammaproteobacteria bacterium]MCP4928014.1 carboxylesterase family protein [Gammaproteobacteria bacterium]
MLIIILFIPACTFNPYSMDYPNVKIDSGYLQGAVVDGVPVFKGIPYAAPPVGDLRWRPPQSVKSWRGSLDATDYAPHCAQYEADILWFDLDEISEDCLTLNVWTAGQNHREKRPVMVWIHGGGYSNGSGNIARLNSPVLARQGVILVTINYRLGPFGFMTHPALAASNPDDPVGNYGLQDVVASLKWVQKNISTFGGDPENVTIFGESAGAGIVNTLLVAPAAEGLFHRAISQSASVGLAPEPYPDRRAGFLPPSNKAGEELVKRLNLNKLGFTDSKSADPELANALRRIRSKDILRALTKTDRYTPVVDGEFLPDQVGVLMAAGEMHKVPYITGGNNWEASLGREVGGGFSPEFAGKLLTAEDKERLYPGLEGEALDDQIFGDLIVLSGSHYVADQMVAQGVPVYSYFLTYVAKARRAAQPGVAHTDDIAFVMQTLDNEEDLEDEVTAADRQISVLMSTYWTQFAKMGNPNREDLPEWPLYTGDNGPILEIGDEIVVWDTLLEERINFHIERGQNLLKRVTK